MSVSDNAGPDAFLFEVAPHPDAGVPVKPQGISRWRAVLYLLLAVLLSAGVILIPLIATVLISFSRPGAWQEVLTDAGAWQAIGNMLIWWLLVVVVCAVGLGLAWLARNAGPALGLVMRIILVLPAVVSPLTTGAVFRLLYDTSHERGVAAALLGQDIAFLGPGWIWLVLGSAFVWQYAGVAFLVFHQALSRLPANLLRVARAFGVNRWGRLWTVALPTLARPASLAYLFALVFAARVFDLVLMGAPGSMQALVEGGGLYWWRHNDDLGYAGAAALAVLMSLLVAALAAPALFGLRGRVTWGDSAPSRRPSAHRARWLWPLGGAVSVLWLLPFAALLITSLRDPVAAAQTGWWNGEPWTLGSYTEALTDSAFTGALGTTFVRAVTVVAVVLLAAVPAAYVLAHEHLLPRRTWQMVLLVAVALAVLPPQAFAVPLQQVLSPIGTVPVLTVVHAALVLPLAVVVLHNAFVRVPAPMLARDRWELFHYVREARPAVVLAGVVVFVLVWNDAVVGLLLNWPSGDHLPLILLEQARHFMSAVSPLAAQAVLATVVPVLVVAVTARLLYQGLTRGVRR
ncbi:ABC transporter permease subunit [Nonomuraea sp. NPDC049309]|uniref:ABC transporter permease subunit n=1 Tax=Nonomuraea sp. NPDC049309 TaxID=3364350 RepID=UPI00371F66D6